ncbi:uncharacterized protein LOC128731245 [Anopheles nili]|uniref:uncharacterized protein LOC128731245 n=1 Tax=Anopheles nili TaxID=185578 RepID=UPI00237B9FF4|nr:uncharacterized protein LOC128731245 [Anopheles nili]
MSSTAPVTVKQERHDEAEINEMAAKIVEAHKQQSAKAAAAAVQQPQAAPARPTAVGTLTANGVTPGQANILNYLTRKPTTNLPANATNLAMAATSGGVTAPTIALPLGSGQSVASNGSGKAYDGGGSDLNGSGEKKVNDDESHKGRFGWEVFPGKVHIPFILRQQERYCAVRMVEMKLLNKYLNYLHQDIYTCTCVRSYYITEAECKLLNEINQKQCDMHFGRELFTLKDLVVRVSDAYKFYQFLDVCYKKLLTGCSTPNEKCGFIRINKESVVPYTVRDYQKMVPLFYFEGETDNLKLKADNLSGWDLSYLKFCCKVQGIRNELFASDSVAVISLTDIKGYFPPGTDFEDYWPSKVVDSQLLSGPKTNTVHWTRQPAQPPPKAPAMMNNAPTRKATNNVYQTLQTQQNLAKTNNQMNTITAAVQALTQNWNMVSQNHPNLLAAQQEQLLRLSQAQQAAQAQAQIRNIQNMHSMQQYNSYLTNAMSLTPRSSQNQPVPPPLVRSAQVQAHLSSGGVGASSALRSTPSASSSGGGNTLPNLNPALSIFATSSNPNGTVNLSRLNQQQISELTMASGSGLTGNGGTSSGTGKTNASRHVTNAAHAAAVARPPSSGVDGFSLGRNVTITPTGGAGGGSKRSAASTLDELATGMHIAASMAGYSGYGAGNSSSSSSKQASVAYPKNPISITAVPVGSPTRASPKGGQARQPPPALIPVGGTGELLDRFATNGVDLLAHLQTRLSKDLEIINERLLGPDRNRGGDNPVAGDLPARERNGNSSSNSSSRHLPSYREGTGSSSTSTTTGSGAVASSVIVHDKSRSNGGRIDYPRNHSVITSTNGAIGGGGDELVASFTARGVDGSSHYLNALIAARLSEVIDLSSTPRSNITGASLPQHLAVAQQAAAVAVAQQQQLSVSSGKRSASGSTGLSGSRSSAISSSSSGAGGSGNGTGAASNSYRNANAAVLQQLQQQHQQQQAQQQQQQQQQVQHQQHAAATAAAAAAINSLAESRHGSNVIVLPEMNISVTQFKPYEVVKRPVENKIIYCVNKTPYRTTEYLMTLFDLKDVFFPYISLEVCRRVLNALDINIFIGNSLQYQVLMEAGRTNVDKMPMVQVSDVVTFMPQLQYMIRSSNLNQETQANKRARIS